MKEQRKPSGLTSYIAPILLTLLLTACAAPIKYDDYLAQYWGLSEQELIQAWGPPQSRIEEDGQIRLTYMSRGERNVMVSPAIREPYFDGKNVHHRIVAPERWRREQTQCETLFIIEQDEVTQYLHWGNGCEAPV